LKYLFLTEISFAQHFNEESLANNIQRNTLRYMRYFEEQADDLMPQPSVNFVEHDVRDTLEVIIFKKFSRFFLFCGLYS
jgi:hypothetical protein